MRRREPLSSKPSAPLNLLDLGLGSVLVIVTLWALGTADVGPHLGRLQVGLARDFSSEWPDACPVSVRVAAHALVVSVSDTALAPLRLEFDTHGRADLRPLTAQLNELKALCPDQHAVTLTVADDVRLALFVQVVDSCVGADFTRVLVSDLSSESSPWTPSPAQKHGREFHRSAVSAPEP